MGPKSNVTNRDAFRSLLPGLLVAHRGEYALVSNGKMAGAFRSVKEAVISAQSRFPDQPYAIYPITDVLDRGSARETTRTV